MFAPDGTPRAPELASAKVDERDVAVLMLQRRHRQGATIVRPRRKDEPGQGSHLALLRQWIESTFWACKALLTLERHGTRTPPRGIAGPGRA